jgi:hypothetical protein
MNTTLAELLFRTFNDPAPDLPAEAAYLFGQTPCNQDSSFSTALQSDAQNILILDTEPRSGYLGFSTWQYELLESGIDSGRIQPVPMNQNIPLNSRTESQALMQYVTQREIQSVEVIAPPFHQLRAFMTAITIALEENLKVAIYSRPGAAVSWHETVVHSQGELTAPRRELIHTELKRIETYQNKGDLASFDRILDYLNRRTP